MTIHLPALDQSSTDADRIYAAANGLPHGTPSPQQMAQLSSLVNDWMQRWPALCDRLRNLHGGSIAKPLLVSGLSQSGAIHTAEAAISAITPFMVHHNLRSHLVPPLPLTRFDTDIHVEGLTALINRFNDFMAKI